MVSISVRWALFWQFVLEGESLHHWDPTLRKFHRHAIELIGTKTHPNLKIEVMPNGTGMFRLVGVCTLLVVVIALHMYNAVWEVEESDMSRLKESKQSRDNSPTQD